MTRTAPERVRKDENQQVLFVARQPDWYVDEQTREVGRRGLDKARTALHGHARRSVRS